MSETLLLRKSRPDDEDFILDALAESAFLTFPEWRRKGISMEMLRDRERANLERFHNTGKAAEDLFIAELDDERVGMLWITSELEGHDNEKVAWVLGIYVVEHERGQGYGGELLRRAESWARAHHLGEVWLRVGSDNDRAIDLYESAGYYPEDIHLAKRV
jgi:GNAT superfamily N-acetyltransferase